MDDELNPNTTPVDPTQPPLSKLDVPESPNVIPEGTETFVEGPKQIDPNAMQEAAGGAGKGDINPNQVNTVINTGLKAGGKVWLWVTLAGIIATVTVVMIGAIYFFNVRGANDESNSSAGGNPEKTAKLICGKIDSDGSLSDGEQRISSASQLEKCLVSKSMQNEGYYSEFFDYKVFQTSDVDGTTGKINDESNAYFDTTGGSAMSKPGVKVIYGDGDEFLEDSETVGRTKDDRMVCTNNGCGGSDSTSYNDFTGTGKYALAKHVDEKTSTLSISSSVQVVSRKLTYQMNKDSAIYHLDYYDVYANNGSDKYYHTSFIFHDIPDSLYRADGVNFGKLVKLYAENIKSI